MLFLVRYSLAILKSGEQSELVFNIFIGLLIGLFLLVIGEAPLVNAILLLFKLLSIVFE